MEKPLVLRIVNRHRTKGGEYVGRPSPLGNPYRFEGEGDRLRAIEGYAAWLEARVREGDTRVLEELERLEGILLERGELVLACWCAPKSCHAEVVARHLQERLRAVGRSVRVEVEGREELPLFPS